MTGLESIPIGAFLPAFLGLIFVIFILVRRFFEFRKMASYDLKTKSSILEPDEKVMIVYPATNDTEDSDEFKRSFLEGGKKGNIVDVSMTTKNRLLVGFRDNIGGTLEIQPQMVQQIVFSGSSHFNGQTMVAFSFGKKDLKLKMMPSASNDLEKWLNKREDFKLKIHHQY